MTAETLPATTQQTDEKRQLALLKAVGLDRLAPEERELALNIASRYELDLLLSHLKIIDGRAYITRDGLLHIAHRSGTFDGIEVTTPVLDGGFWRCSASVYRKDMTRPFTYPGRYPAAGRGKGPGSTYAEEMAIKVAESMALRRAFDVSAPVVDEQWGEAVVEDPGPAPTLAERARAKAVAVAVEAGSAEATVAAPEAPGDPIAPADESDVHPEPDEAPGGICGAASPYEDGSEGCTRAAGHRGNHQNGARESW